MSRRVTNQVVDDLLLKSAHQVDVKIKTLVQTRKQVIQYALPMENSIIGVDFYRCQEAAIR